MEVCPNVHFINIENKISFLFSHRTEVRWQSGSRGLSPLREFEGRALKVLSLATNSTNKALPSSEIPFGKALFQRFLLFFSIGTVHFGEKGL